MKNVAMIFAGGTGQRMKTKSTPKQFLQVHGKPIIIYTLENFERHPLVDAIVIVCLEQYIGELRSLLVRYGIRKVSGIVPGGKSGQESIRNGLLEAARLFDPEDSLVLIHDGVRPFIDADVISRNIETAAARGNAVTVTPAIETVVSVGTGPDGTDQILERSTCRHAKAPQTFVLRDILALHGRALKDGYDAAIDSASLANHYGVPLHFVEGNVSNIKITTPQDFYFMRALLEMEENRQLEKL